MYNEQASSSTDPVGVSLVEELRLTRSSQQASLAAESATPEPKDGLVDFCEAAAVRLLSHAVSGEGLVPYQGALGNGELDAASSFGECNSCAKGYAKTNDGIDANEGGCDRCDAKYYYDSVAEACTACPTATPNRCGTCVFDEITSCTINQCTA